MSDDSILVHRKVLRIHTHGRGTTDLTREVQSAVRASGAREGLCTAFVHHTSASLIVCENADSEVRRDLETFLSSVVPDGDPRFIHVAEGPDDMPAHVRTILTQTSISLPIAEGRCDLGTWQGVYLYEHRHASHERKITLTIVGR
jgi:secondary thiamine-phosphate synthase enzyme